MRLRADVGEVDEVLADWWQEFSLADDGVREDLLQQARSEQQKAQRAPRVHSVKRASKSPSASSASADTPDPRFRDADNSHQDDQSDDMHANDAPAKKRRRRRRKPAGGAGGSAAPE
jgi:poly(A) polymerase